jgi:hypothetical protein
MNPAVARLLDEREAQGLPRHIEDSTALERVATLLARDQIAQPSG